MAEIAATTLALQKEDSHGNCGCGHQPTQKPDEAHKHSHNHSHSHSHSHNHNHSHKHGHTKLEVETKETNKTEKGGSERVVEDIEIDVKDAKSEVTVHSKHEHSHGHGHGHDHGHSHDHGGDNPHPQGTAIQYKEAPPQFGVADHVDDIIHTEFRYVSGFKPFQFNAPGSCLGPLNPKSSL